MIKEESPKYGVLNWGSALTAICSGCLPPLVSAPGVVMLLTGNAPVVLGGRLPLTDKVMACFRNCSAEQNPHGRCMMSIYCCYRVLANSNRISGPVTPCSQGLTPYAIPLFPSLSYALPTHRGGYLPLAILVTLVRAHYI